MCSGVHDLVSAFVLLLIVCTSALAPDRASAAAPPIVEEPSTPSDGQLQYHPGQGLRLGSSGGVIGGFTNIKAERSEQAGAAFALSNLNFFLIYDHFSRFRAVADLQMRDIFEAGRDRAGTQDFAFDVRRLFGDLTIADSLHLRVGTFLTPVGYWNLILASPLTWTTEQPLITEEVFFQSTTTGLMVHGSTGVADGQLAYSLFSQLLKPLEDDPDLVPPDYTVGLRTTYEASNGWSLGASYQASNTGSEWSQLEGLHLLWQPRRGEVLSEVYFQEGEGLGLAQWGTYLQGVVEVVEPFYLVGRYEHFAPADPDPSIDLITMGAVYRPLPYMAIKIEYRVVVDPPPEDSPAGVYSSFTTFF